MHFTAIIASNLPDFNLKEQNVGFYYYRLS